jgi:hypothetical protein
MPNVLLSIFWHYLFFSENLQTEVEVWNDMNKLKHLPIPLSQKKSMRLQYQVITFSVLFSILGFWVFFLAFWVKCGLLSLYAFELLGPFEQILFQNLLVEWKLWLVVLLGDLVISGFQNFRACWKV